MPTAAAVPPTAPPATAPFGGPPAPQLAQAVEATNAAMDVYLRTHKAAEAKAVLAKYGAKRISDLTDMSALEAVYREFGGQANAPQ